MIVSSAMGVMSVKETPSLKRRVLPTTKIRVESFMNFQENGIFNVKICFSIIMTAVNVIGVVCVAISIKYLRYSDC